MAQDLTTGYVSTSLGWSQPSELALGKGKLLYLDLLEKLAPRHDLPYRVYLDQPDDQEKTQFPCKKLSNCNGKQIEFSRPADLERHYKNEPRVNKDSFPCDYAKCSRFQDLFTRKDHYRDHPKDFHKEDAEGENLSSDNKKGQKEQRHWRCRSTKCLVKNYVSRLGWTCPRHESLRPYSGIGQDTYQEDASNSHSYDAEVDQGYSMMASSPYCGASIVHAIHWIGLVYIFHAQHVRLPTLQQEQTRAHQFEVLRASDASFRQYTIRKC
ncbi:hypothetical protein N431DRAFT_484518 [Stipitochalara longipes BDJ]|nr:hypothetical protein N431DRAFT_484518 [Stipitochalara longipes BDJ]